MTEQAPRARHPLAELPAIVGRLPRYLVLARELLRDPKLSRARKAALAAGLAYLASPLDLVPGIIPVAGQLDDLAAVLLTLRFALRGCTRAAGEAHLRTAGLTTADIDRDLAAVQAAGGWIAGRAAQGAVRIGKASVRGARTLAGLAARGVARGAARATGRASGQAGRGRRRPASEPGPRDVQPSDLDL